MENMKDIEVSDDHILLSDICHSYGIPPKQLAIETGRAGSTVYKYLAGELTIPSVVWRRVYQISGDIRCVQLITGDCQLIPLPQIEITGKADAATVGHMMETQKCALEIQAIIMTIIFEKKQGRSTKVLTGQLKQIFPRSIELQMQLYNALVKGDEDADSK